MIHARTLNALEFHRIADHLSELCLSGVGRERARAIAPLDDAEAVTLAARIYEEAADWASRPAAGGAVFCVCSFPDVSGMLRAAATSRAHTFQPDVDAFWALREVLRLARDAHASIAQPEAATRWPHLLAMADGSPLPVQLTAALLRCISDDGLLRDESSPELYRLRGELRRLHQSCMRKVKDFAQQYNMLAYLQDEFMTLSSDRYVLPLKANFKGRMQGIIHDWSQTGETCYFEPMFLVEINNRLQELKREEREEERKVLVYLRSLLEAELPGARAALELLAQLDVLQAKRRLAALFDGRPLPLTPVAEGIQLLDARHPLLMLNRVAESGKDGSKAAAAAHSKVRPLDIVLRPGERALVITGGNAGGKTVCLKTLGLIAAMTLSGLPVPVGAGSHMPWFSRLDAFIGDEQSLADNVSTFTAQIEHLAKAWKHLDASSLVLLDEFGAGTDPAQGAALAQAVLDELLDKHTFVLSATHFPALKSYALTREGARAASMLFDPQSKKPLFRLAYDQVGASQALDVAREHGLAESIVRRAEHYLLQDGQDATALLGRLNDLAAKREEELAELKREQDKTRRQTQDLREKLEKERLRLHDEVRAQAGDLMRAWKEGRATHKQALKEMSRLRASLAPAQDETAEGASVLPQPQTFTAGQEVLHTVFNKRGVITDVDERRGRVRLEMNGVNLWAEMKALRVPGQTAPSPSKSALRGVVGRTSASDEAASLRLDMRGMRADVALAELERFMDKALLAGFSEVEVVHGRGTGALRRQVHDFLRSFPAVGQFALAPEDRGGDGMTIVTFR
ncbi:Endonuclease MutS2 [uncultured Desulfovibrio sp.]|uniref:Endonuclease MutS2 n=1 Tax=uncultured Desulfovibrio sp. TaxID=167968 RepID=A0A212KJN3_9BACT|nr:Smr/MutS family protein [Desulfovibrio desulfuricans]MCB6540965.1 Smr/MutS family protein [Desulfovibrio desulfuricans]MCB6552047.1 Smr/MutS family protein [Desulfovibrio desulfuricans]MCB6563889.1 Smr/MutS family protein [Desulfovibrio desulfuricans]MCB7345097.1 Smr/MutS family protein [Desulfovibrio desulfuricans]MCQ4859966.1 Smr/MutS family protein [Desulfovibrio desulfuricans]